MSCWTGLSTCTCTPLSEPYARKHVVMLLLPIGSIVWATFKGWEETKHSPTPSLHSSLPLSQSSVLRSLLRISLSQGAAVEVGLTLPPAWVIRTGKMMPCPRCQVSSLQDDHLSSQWEYIRVHVLSCTCSYI